ARGVVPGGALNGLDVRLIQRALVVRRIGPDASQAFGSELDLLIGQVAGAASGVVDVAKLALDMMVVLMDQTVRGGRLGRGSTTGRPSFQPGERHEQHRAVREAVLEHIRGPDLLRSQLAASQAIE